MWVLQTKFKRKNNTSYIASPPCNAMEIATMSATHGSLLKSILNVPCQQVSIKLHNTCGCVLTRWKLHLYTGTFNFYQRCRQNARNHNTFMHKGYGSSIGGNKVCQLRLLSYISKILHHSTASLWKSSLLVVLPNILYWQYDKVLNIYVDMREKKGGGLTSEVCDTQINRIFLNTLPCDL